MKEEFDAKKNKKKSALLLAFCFITGIFGIVSIICAFEVGVGMYGNITKHGNYSMDSAIIMSGDDPKDYYGTYYVKAKERYLTFELSENGCVFTNSNGMVSTVETYQYNYVSAKYLKSRLEEGYDYDDPAILVYLDGKPSLIESSNVIVMRILKNAPYVFSVEGGTTTDKPIDFRKDMGDPKDYYGVFKHLNFSLTLNVDYTFLLKDSSNSYTGKYAYVTDAWLNKFLRGNYSMNNGALALHVDEDNSYFVFEYNGPSTLTFNNDKYTKETSYSAVIEEDDEPTTPTQTDPEPTQTDPEPTQTEEDYGIFLNFSYYYKYNGYFVTGYNYSPTKIVVPEKYNDYNVVGIAEKAFLNCTSLKEIVIPDSVLYIENYIFDGCSALENITIPFVGTNYIGIDDQETILSMYDRLENGASKIFDDPINAFGSLFASDHFALSYKITQVNEYFEAVDYYIPFSLKKVKITSKIGTLAFANMTIDFDLELCDSIADISVMAFLSANIESITIPKNVDCLNHGLFSDANVDELIFGTNVTEIGSEALCSNLSILYDGTKNEWYSIQKEEGWAYECENITVTCKNGVIRY